MIIHSDKYCVYSHSAGGVIKYIGCGGCHRPLVITSRNHLWNAMFLNSEIEVKIIAWFSTRDEALEKEASMIKEINPECNCEHNSKVPRRKKRPPDANRCSYAVKNEEGRCTRRSNGAKYCIQHFKLTHVKLRAKIRRNR